MTKHAVQNELCELGPYHSVGGMVSSPSTTNADSFSTPSPKYTESECCRASGSKQRGGFVTQPPDNRLVLVQLSQENAGGNTRVFVGILHSLGMYLQGSPPQFSLLAPKLVYLFSTIHHAIVCPADRSRIWAVILNILTIFANILFLSWVLVFCTSAN